MVTSSGNDLPASVYEDAEVLWEFHHLGHRLEPCSVGIGMGSRDLEVATFTAELFKRGLFPLIVFTGATSNVTRDRFPRGEAVRYREEAVRLGVPDNAILLETRATNTKENILLSRQLLDERNVAVDSILFVCRPSQERRASLIAKRIWPGPPVICTSPPITLRDYFGIRGSPKAVVDMLVGDTQRILADREIRGPGDQVPRAVVDAYERLVYAGFTGRLM